MPRVALITGATSAIGAAAARAFAETGHAVVLTARRKDVLDALASSISENGGDALAVPADVTDSAAMDAVVQKAVERFGGLDVAFNNAGGGPPPKPLAELEPAEFDLAVQTILSGTFFAMRAEIRAMLNRGGGAIVNMSSTAGLQGVARIAAYCATKHGVVGLSKAAALDYAANNIRINVVAPGPIATERIDEKYREQIAEHIPVKRIGDPKDVADLVRWLCSSEAQFITGTVVTIDGGKLAGTPAYSVRG